MPPRRRASSCSGVGQSSTITATFSISVAELGAGSRRARRRPCCSNSVAGHSTTGANVPRRAKFLLQSRAARRYVARPVNTGPVPEANDREAGYAQAGWNGTRAPEDGPERIRCGDRAERDHPREARTPEAAPRPSTWGNPGARNRRTVGGNGPEEIRAATQRRLLGAFRCSGPGAAVSARWSVASASYPARYRAAVDALLDGLDATQRDAVTSRAAPLAILAGAGSGKTRVLTRRIAWQSREGLVDPPTSLAVTFTRKAAGELRARLARLGVRESVTAGTFHAIALAQLRRRRRRAGPHDARAPRPQGAAPRAAPPRSAAAKARCVAAELASEIEWAKARLVKPDGVRGRGRARRAHHAPPAGRGRRALRRYEREKRKRGLVDFDDLISGAPTCSSATPSSRPRSAGGSVTSSSTSSRTRAAAQFRLLRVVARRPPRPVRRRRPRPGDLRVRRRRRVTYLARLPARVPGRALPRRRRRAARQQLPVDAAGRRGGGAVLGPPAPSTSAGARGAARRSPARRSPTTPPPTTKRAASPARCAAPRARSCRGRAWPCSTASTRSRRCSRRR